MDRKKLLKLCNKVSRAIKPSIQPIMECILIHIKDGTVTIRAASHGMQIMVWEKIDDTSTQLLAAVNAVSLKELLNRLPADEVSLSKVGDILSIKSGSISLTIPCRKEPFPKEMQKGEAKAKAVIPCKDIEACKHSALSKAMINEKMSSYGVDIKGDSYRITTVDGHRLSSRGKGTDVFSNALTKIVAPGEMMEEAVKISEEDDFEFVYDGNNIQISGSGYSIIGATQFNCFFNLEQIRNPGFTSYFEVNRISLLEALKVATYFDKLTVLKIQKDNLILSSRDAAKGDSHAEVPIVTNGKEIELGVNGNFLCESLDSIPEETLRIYYSSKIAPIYFESDSFKEVIMPVRY